MTPTRLTLEQQAAGLISAALQCDVALHDDGSSNSMYDLRVGPAAAPLMAIECTCAVDPVRTETWNVGFADGGPLKLRLRGDWGATVQPGVRLKGIESQVQSLLAGLEEVGADSLDAGYRLKRTSPDLDEICEAAGIVGVHRIREEGSGEVHLWMEGIGGAVNTSGEGVAEWVGEFLRAPERADVISKLRSSGAEEREVFVAVTFGGAPWRVESYLGSESNELPSRRPDLPDPITGIWLVGMSKRLRYNSEGWKFVRENT